MNKHTITVHTAHAMNAREIDRRDRKSGLAEIGYHWVITPDGLIEPGRDEKSASVHDALHLAKHSISICLLGKPDPAQRSTFQSLCRDIMHRHDITHVIAASSAIPQGQVDHWLLSRQPD
jgi:hypothetical protein